MSQSELGQKQKLHVILDVINRILNLPELGSWTQQKWSVDSELLIIGLKNCVFKLVDWA